MDEKLGTQARFSGDPPEIKEMSKISRFSPDFKEILAFFGLNLHYFRVQMLEFLVCVMSRYNS